MKERDHVDETANDIAHRKALDELWSMSKFAWRVRAHPVFKVIAAVLILTSAFSTGIAWGIGFSMIPVVDAGSFLAPLFFYISVLMVALTLIGSALAAWLRQNAFLEQLFLSGFERISKFFPVEPFEGEDAYLLNAVMQKRLRQGNEIFANLIVRFMIGITVCAVAFGVIASIAAAGQWSVAVFLGEHWWLWLCCLLLGLYVAATFAPKTKSIPPTGRMTFEFARFFLVGTVLLAGVAWVDFMKEVGPSVQLKLSRSDTASSAALLLPAHEGMIVFFRVDGSTQYVAWSSIVSIKAE